MSILQNNVQCGPKNIKILIDSGVSASIIHDSFVLLNKLKTRQISSP